MGRIHNKTQQSAKQVQIQNSDVIVSAIASQIYGVSIVWSTVFSRHLPLWEESTGDRWIPLTGDT